MSDDYQWQQLGSIVNAVLMDTRTKAIRKGARFQTPRNPPQNARPAASALAPKKLGNGFLNPDYQAPVSTQLELPFGVAPAPEGSFARPSRGTRLM